MLRVVQCWLNGEQTPLTAYALEVLALQAGLPADVLINISGDAVEVGKTLCESDIVRVALLVQRKLRILMQQCGANHYRELSLELAMHQLWHLTMPILNKQFRASWQVNIVTAVAGVQPTVFMFDGIYMHWQSVIEAVFQA